MELQIITNQVEQTQYVLLDKNMRLVKPINDYLAYLRLRGKADNTQRAYARDLKVYFDYLENEQQEYDKVDISMIQDYVGYLRSPSAGGVFLYSDSKRTPTTINRMLGTVYGFYCYQAAMNRIHNPILMKDINSPNSIFKNILVHTKQNNYVKQSIFKVKESDYHIHLITQEEASRMYELLPTARDKMIFKLLLQTGARIGEVLALRIGNVPIPDNSEPVSILPHVKSKGGYRDIYIPTKLLEELDEYILQYRSSVSANHDFIFTVQQAQYRGKPVSYRGLYEVFRRIGKQAGINFKFHDTRHTFVTGLVESGMDISVVRIIAGHKHVTTTQQYVTLSNEYVAQSLMRYWSCSGMIGGGQE